MESGDLIALAMIISQTGLAAAAWRLATKMDKRLGKHEEDDRVFHKQVREALHIPEPKGA